jgi:hypothetical protein
VLIGYNFTKHNSFVSVFHLGYLVESVYLEALLSLLTRLKRDNFIWID